MLAIMPFLAYGQITVNQGDMPLEGNHYLQGVVADFTGVDQSVTGANATWDYSNLVAISTDTVTTVSVSATPVAYQFFFNNIFIYPDHYSNYAVEAADIDGGGFVTLSDRYEYFKQDGTGHKLTGFGANINGVPTSVRYDNVDVIYDFPMTFGNVDSSFADYLITVPTFGTYGQDIYRKKEVDGWGSLTTPYGSFDCLRVKTTLNLTDTIYSDNFMFGTSFDRPEQVIYDWVTNGEGIPVLTMVENAGTLSEVRFKSASWPVNVDEQENMKLHLYPNPTIEKLVLTSQGQEAYSIIDSNGNLVQAGSLEEGANELNVATLTSGIYLIVTSNGSGTFVVD